MKIRYRLVFNRRHYADLLGRSLIQIEARQASKKAYFSTGVYIREEEWNGTVTGHPNASRLNAYILDLMIKLEDIELDLWKHGITPTLDHLRQSWRAKEKLTDFGTFARSILRNNGRKKCTQENLNGTIRKCEAFRKVPVSQIDYCYLKDFEQWLRDRGIHNNTIAKQMTNIRTIISEALRCGMIKDDPFLQYQKPKLIPKPHITLTESEIGRISKVPIHPNVRDAFIFCCRTGLRYSDYRNLSNAQWKKQGKKLWLIVDTQKTGVEVRLPMHLIGDISHPDIGCNSDTNRQLKEILKAAKIDKHVTFHTARHTFATSMLNRGVDITTVQRLLGHTSVRMTQKYAETKDFKVEHDLRKAFKVDNG